MPTIKQSRKRVSSAVPPASGKARIPHRDTPADRFRRRVEFEQAHLPALHKLPNEKLFSLREVAERLSLSEWTLRHWMTAGKMHYRRVGRLVRIPASEVARLSPGYNQPNHSNPAL